MVPHIVYSILDSLNSPQARHAMAVHVPIGVGVVGVIWVVGLMITAGRSSGVRWCCVVLYLVGMAAAFLTAETGEQAEDWVVESQAEQLGDEAIEGLEIHEELGENVWIGMGVTAGVIALTAVPSTVVRVCALAISLLCGLTMSGYLAVTAHHGGLLVYKHGVGVPARPNHLVRPQSTEPLTDIETETPTGASLLTPKIDPIDTVPIEGEDTDPKQDASEQTPPPLMASPTESLPASQPHQPQPHWFFGTTEESEPAPELESKPTPSVGGLSHLVDEPPVQDDAPSQGSYDGFFRSEDDTIRQPPDLESLPFEESFGNTPDEGPYDQFLTRPRSEHEPPPQAQDSPTAQTQPDDGADPSSAPPDDEEITTFFGLPIP